MAGSGSSEAGAGSSEAEVALLRLEPALLRPEPALLRLGMSLKADFQSYITFSSKFCSF